MRDPFRRTAQVKRERQSFPDFSQRGTGEHSELALQTHRRNRSDPLHVGERGAFDNASLGTSTSYKLFLF